MATTKKTTAKKVTAKKAAAPRTKKAPVIEAGKGEAMVYGMNGAPLGAIALPAELFGAKWNADLVHQVVTGMQANARPTVANTKFRGEVSGGGKKPWKQKGTGRARHGSTRSPIWRHGGITHGPRAERDYSVKINKKMRMAALVALLSRKYRDGEVILVESMSFTEPKTAAAVTTLKAIAKGSGVSELMTKRVNAAVIAFSKKDTTAEKSLRNIGSMTLEEVRNLNPVDLVTKKYLVIENPKESFAILMARLTK